MVRFRVVMIVVRVWVGAKVSDMTLVYGIGAGICERGKLGGGALDQVGGAFGDHDGGGVGVAAHHAGHY